MQISLPWGNLVRLWGRLSIPAWMGCAVSLLGATGDLMITKVETGLVRERKLSQVFEFPGSLEAFQEVEISSKASGQIISMKVSEGERVRKGQLLFELDARGDRIALVRAEAELEKAQYDLQRLEAGYQPLEIEESRRRMTAAEAVFTAARDDWQRTTLLAEQGISAASELGKARSEYDVAIAQLSQAKARLALIESGFRSEDIQIARSEVKVRRAQVDDIKRQLEDHQVLAPFDGVISVRLKEEQEWTSEGQPILVLLVLNPMKLRVEAPQRSVVLIKPGQTATVTVPGLEGEEFQANVLQVIPQAQTGSRNFPVLLQMDNGDGRLSAGMYAKVRLEIDEKPRVLTIPREAIQYREQKMVVYRVDPVVEKPGSGDSTERDPEAAVRQDSTAVEVQVTVVKEMQLELVIEARQSGELWGGCEVVVMGGNRLTGGAPLHRLNPGAPIVRAN
ncbi:MAG: efflux RND transporter periplasmic adaptor subunit [Verrucomicrobia bacterium]|nr:efflux RND transporter periplasmic adaptor subunit [Verrucomicrobiota bacterium]